MDTNVVVDSVQSGLNDVIAGHFNSPPKIQVSEGSAAGDGYSAKTYSINLKENGKIIDVFVKYVPNIDYPKEALAMFGKAFSNEHKFYKETFPAMLKFQQERSIAHPFTNVINYFCTNSKDGEIPPLFLENIKPKGYELRDRKKPIDDEHIRLVLTTQAKFHAVSFAMKDQNPELFKQLSSGLGDVFSDSFKDFGMDGLVSHGVKELNESIDPVADKKLYDCLHNLADNLVELCSTLDTQADEYAVICQGDSWSNNMMFLYDANSTTKHPIGIKLLDWQVTRLNSPVLDVAYFFYTVATKEVLDNFDNYMEIYYDTLSKQITALGSDPEKLYPERIFKQHWQKLSKFGFAMSFMIVKALLFDDDEIPSMVDSTEVKIDPQLFGATIKKQDVYIQKIKDLLEHFIDRNFL